MLNEISKEQFEKFEQKYEKEKRILIDEVNNSIDISSNLEKAVEKGLNLAQNLSEIWHSSDYTMKQTLQYLIFADGILYDKKNGTVRTQKTNTLFRLIPYLTGVPTKKQKSNLEEDCLFGSKVGMTRFELATPRPPDVCATGLRYIPNFWSAAKIVENSE